jgi:hypothetical protein
MNWLPEHKCGLHLEHNEHRNYYQTVEECYDPEDFVSEEEWLKAIKEDSVWVLQWYPNTPIGFNRIAASTLEAIETELKQKNGYAEEENTICSPFMISELWKLHK